MSSSSQAILAFDTALGPCSVAVWKGDCIAAQRVIEERNQQTSQLVPVISELMDESGLSLKELSSIATTIGPGSFTGIRIGLATARGLSLATAVPIKAITTLELFAWQAVQRHRDKDVPILSVINAYRNQLYWQKFHYAEVLVPEEAASIVSLSELPEKLPSDAFILAGDAAKLFDGYGHVQDRTQPMLSASALAEYVVHHELPLKRRVDIKPLYLRPPDAKPQRPLLQGNS